MELIAMADIFEERRLEIERQIRVEERKQKWRRTMEAKYGGKEGLRKHYRELKRRSMEHPNNQPGKHRGGFSDPKIASKAGARSKRGKAKPKGRSKKKMA